MTQPLLDEIHLGEILLEEFMKPMGITVDTAARIRVFHPAAT